MSEYTIFPNAPITEAILDIRAELSKDIILSKLTTFHDHVKERFPEKEERISFTAGFKLSQEGPETLPTSGGPDGYLFRSPATKKIVQARLDGFTLNKLKPYENWAVFRSEARELWNLYFQVTNPVKITRIALRYINRIEIPLPMGEFKEYILTVPEIAPDLPQGLSQFFMQLVIPNNSINAVAIINQTMELVTPTQKLPLIFDIDISKVVDYKGDNIKMWEDFDSLRMFKNEIFFKSITKKTEELFK